MKDRIFEALATGFYSGKSPVAPGTMGTLVAIPLVWAMGQFLSPVFYMAAAILMVAISIPIAQWYENQKGVHDCQEIVLDEIVGFVITMAWLPMSWQAFVAGFVLFRLLDMFKPFPIGMIDKKVDGGLGVIADDVVAGIMANFILQVVYTQTNWLGSQWLQ